MTSIYDGWCRVWEAGTYYWEMWDDGVFVIRCTLHARDDILRASDLPLKEFTKTTSKLIVETI